MTTVIAASMAAELHKILGDSYTTLLGSHPSVASQILRIAKRLEALQEYHPKQALFVAADIVRCRFNPFLKTEPSMDKEKLK
jgi:hypothetical protein